MPAAAVRESKERVRAALTNSGFEFPAGRITVSLAPADLPKEGGRFDLPIALGILLASRQLRARPGAGTLLPCEFYGELSLGGELLQVRGMTLAAAHAAQEGHEIIVPLANVPDTRIVRDSHTLGARSLLEVCGHLQGEPRPPTVASLPEPHRPGAADLPDLADVRGQQLPRRALVIAAAGAHSLLCADRRVPARPCSPNGCCRCCRPCPRPKRSKWRASPR